MTADQVDSFSSDTPVGEMSEDLFARAEFARRIAETLSRRSDHSGLVVGLYGRWGEGKTSVLQFVEQHLASEPGVVVSFFNPWRFSGQDQLTRAFIGSLAESLKASLTTPKQQLGEFLSNWAAALIPTVGYEGASINAGEAVSRVGESLSYVPLEDARSRLSDILREEGKRVVVLVDDLDRLDNNELHAMLKLVKQTGDFDYVSYLLALDDEVVANSLNDRYGTADSASGAAFLEKIVQVPLRLPPADRIALRRLCLTGLEQALVAHEVELSEEEVRDFQVEFVSGLEPRLSTPRAAKRFGNALRFSLPLVRGEVNLVDHLLVEGTRIFYPGVYRSIVDHPSAYLGTSRYDAFRDGGIPHKDVLEAALATVPARSRKPARQLLRRLFPRTAELLSETGVARHDFDERWTHDRRVCSPAYFNRYFTFAISDTDLSDQAVDAFLSGLPCGDAEEALEHLRGLLSPQNAESAIQKLRHRETELGSDASRQLGLALASIASDLPHPPTLLGVDTPFGQAAILVTQLIRNVERPARARASLELVRASPIDFSIQFEFFLNPRQDEPPLDQSEFEDIGRAIAEKIEDELRSDPSRLHDDKTPSRLAAWGPHSPSPVISDFIRNAIAADSGLPLSLVRSYTPNSWGSETPGPSKQAFNQQDYVRLCSVVDPDIVFQVLVDEYGPELGVESTLVARDRDEFLANQFAFHHREATAGAAAGDAQEGEAP